VFPIIGQQGQIVVKRNGGNGGIRQRKRISLPAPLISEGASLFRNILGYIVIEESID